MFNKDTRINIGGLDFEWNLEKGLFLFEKEDAVLFWIESAMGAFIDTIGEISGKDATNLVLEATGYRQGTVVAEYFLNKKDVSIGKALQMINNTYASAGWGHFSVQKLDVDNKIVAMEIKDSWEYKIIKSKGEKRNEYLLPAHFAGILSRFFKTKIWFDVDHYQLQGRESTIVNYSPSDITISDNIHRLARKKETEEISKLESLVQDKTRELEDLITKLSSPIIPVLDGIIVIPLLGKYETKRAEDLIEKTLKNVPNHDADYIVFDMTGLDEDINESTVKLIESLSSAMSVIGLKVIVVGISPTVSRTMVSLGVDLSAIDSFQSLQHGIHYALRKMGRRIL